MTRALCNLAGLIRRMLWHGPGHGVRPGCVRIGRRVYALTEDLVLGPPPCTGKSGYPDAWILSQPGAASAASARAACPDPSACPLPYAPGLPVPCVAAGRCLYEFGEEGGAS